MRKNIFLRVQVLLSSILFFVLMSCTQNAKTDLAKAAIIPKPVSIEAGGESFKISCETGINYNSDSDEVMKIGQSLAKTLGPATGFEMEVSYKTSPDKGSIFMKLSDDFSKLGDEGYKLAISKDLLTISAFKPAGLFYGMQTLLQVLPEKIYEPAAQNCQWYVPTGNITDYPRFDYRGSMLDVSRHFFGVEDVKRYIDLLATYKMNVLHLHLTDDQGWRIEIKSWPKLTEIGGSTEVGGGEGGFYTQEQFKEIVNYAKDKFITVVPEFEIPGHSNAALASYAELNCDGIARELYTGTEVGFSTVCTQNERTYEFVNDVIRELAAISPGPYIHIGGDESLSTEKDDYIYFITRVQEIVIAHGKTMIGWEEIAQADILPGTIVQFWADDEHAKQAVKKGNKIIMSPAKKIYLDMMYDSTSPLGLNWAAYIEVDNAFMWEPTDYIDGISKENILGIEAPLWSETLTIIDDIEFMLFPRMPGYAEIGWSPPSGRNWDEYKVRLASHGKRFKALEINFYPSGKVNWDK